MAKLLKLRGGTTTQHGSFTGADREVTVDTDKETLVVHNGSTAGGFPLIRNVVEDATPQLGGNLDVSTHGLVSTTNRNIAITPNGSGKVILDGLSHPTADGSASQFLQTNGSGVLSFATVDTTTKLDDLALGDAASTLATSAGNITIDAQGSDTDIIFKGTDGASDITALTLDMSDAGKAIFTGSATIAGTLGATGLTTLGNNLVIPNGGNIGSAGDTDAIAIATNGVVTFSQTPIGAGGGKVLQVVQGGRTSAVGKSGMAYGDVGVSVAITPAATSSKVLVNVTGAVGTSNASGHGAIRLFRGSTAIDLGTGGSSSIDGLNGNCSAFGQGLNLQMFSLTFLDSPSTSSAVTYKIQLSGFHWTSYLGRFGGGTSIAIPTRITCTEIGT